MAIEIVDYDDAWPHKAEAACIELRDSLPGLSSVGPGAHSPGRRASTGSN